MLFFFVVIVFLELVVATSSIGKMHTLQTAHRTSTKPLFLSQRPKIVRSVKTKVAQVDHPENEPLKGRKLNILNHEEVKIPNPFNSAPVFSSIEHTGLFQLTTSDYS